MGIPYQWSFQFLKHLWMVPCFATWFGKRLYYNHSVLFALVFYSTSALFAATRRLTPSQIDTACMCCCRLKGYRNSEIRKRNMIDTDVFEEKHESSSPSVVSKIQCLDERANLREGVIILVWVWHLSTCKRIYIYTHILMSYIPTNFLQMHNIHGLSYTYLFLPLHMCIYIYIHVYYTQYVMYIVYIYVKTLWQNHASPLWVPLCVKSTTEESPSGRNQARLTAVGQLWHVSIVC